MNVTQNVTIDMLNPRKNVIHVVQGDNARLIELTLLAGNNPYNVSDGLASGETLKGVVEYKNIKNGYGDTYEETSLGVAAVTQKSGTTNVWIVALDGRCFFYGGWTQVNVKFEGSGGGLIRTFAIMADVEPAAGINSGDDPAVPMYDGGVVYE